MPKSAANLTSGGFSSVPTLSGNDAAFDKRRPASSLSSSGSSIRNEVCSGKPGPKLTLAMPLPSSDCATFAL